MDAERFDQLTRALAIPSSRRQISAALIGFVGGLVVGRSPGIVRAAICDDACGDGCITPRSSTPLGRPTLISPAAKPASVITSCYHQSNEGHSDIIGGAKLYNYYGIDFASNKKGQTFNVVAAASGRVVYRDETAFDAAGNTVGTSLSIYIDHGAGWFTKYAHLSKRSASDGAQVKQGQVIGKSGNTGCPGCGVHLHFELRYGSRVSTSSASMSYPAPDAITDFTQGPCKGNTTRCGDSCVSTECKGGTFENCECHCPNGATFNSKSGQCTCPRGYDTVCKGTCTDSRCDSPYVYDPDLCGCACPNWDCPAGASINSETCECECPQGQTVCGDACVDTKSDPKNCGGCGASSATHVCADSQTCLDGICGADCIPLGQTCSDVLPCCAGEVGRVECTPWRGVCEVMGTLEIYTMDLEGNRYQYGVQYEIYNSEGTSVLNIWTGTASSNPFPVTYDALPPGDYSILARGGVDPFPVIDQRTFTIESAATTSLEFRFGSPCGDTLQLCGNLCAELSGDPNNCGECGTVCAGQCIDGTCTPSSPGICTEGGMCADGVRFTICGTSDTGDCSCFTDIRQQPACLREEQCSLLESCVGGTTCPAGFVCVTEHCCGVPTPLCLREC